MIAFIAFSVMHANAQTTPGKTSPNDPPALVAINDSLGHVLGLTNDQMKKIQEADDRYREGASKGDKDALEKRDRDLKAILLPSQYTEWKGMIEQQRNKTQPK